LNSGKLNKKVKVLKPTESSGEYGGTDLTFSEAFKRWAEVRPVSGREPYLNDQKIGQTDYVVTMRYDGKTKTINEQYQISYDGKILEIESIINVVEEDKEIRFFCVVYNGD